MLRSFHGPRFHNSVTSSQQNFSLSLSRSLVHSLFEVLDTSDNYLSSLTNSSSAMMSSWSFTDPRMPTCMDLEVSINPSSIAYASSGQGGGRRATYHLFIFHACFIASFAIACNTVSNTRHMLGAHARGSVERVADSNQGQDPIPSVCSPA